MKSVVKVSKFWLMKLESDNLKKRQILIGQQNILYNIWIGKIHRVFFMKSVILWPNILYNIWIGKIHCVFDEFGRFMTNCPIQYLKREMSRRFFMKWSFYDQMSYTIFE